MPDKSRKVEEHHSLPEIKVDIKTPPNSGGMMDWGPIFGWFKSLFSKKAKK
ncbi:hypothetical protein IWT5_00575 [Secundilactobacillus silagincola]|uniref:Uncharacterized protein n=1 Tax=Secundilactobacillus silagincola TaxID=1714681 RepID=A0A1Z5H562_9LACO|nr:hypothetical protein [Secundilactobacillus silagincola]GAT18301.1 hypothetical protein IWT5_00575 [Secundilactobacillus silagincola]